MREEKRFFASKQVFVSGGAGVIGHALVNLLIEEGANVFVSDLKPCPKEWLDKVSYRMGDLAFITKQEIADFSPEIVFHLAATFERSTESFSFYNENFHHNVLVSHHLMDCLKEVPTLKKVVFASSYLIYNPDLYMASTPSEKPFVLTETSPVRPRNICGAAKLFHEEELIFFQHFFKKSPQLASARIFRVYGCNSKDIISRWISQAIEKKSLSVYFQENMFDYIFAEDVALGLLKMGENDVSGVMNLGSGTAHSILDVLKILKKHFPYLNVETIPLPETEPPLYEASVASMQKTKDLLQWTPIYTLETGIEKLIAFLKNKACERAPHHKNILVTSISKKVPLIESVKHAAKKIGAGKVFGCDAEEEPIAKHAVEKFWNCLPTEDLSCDDILDYCLTHEISAIIPTRDGELAFFAEIRDFLATQGIHVMISDPESIAVTLDKKRFAEKLPLHAIPTYLSLENQPEGRYVVKERFGAGSIDIFLNLSKKSAQEAAKRLKNPIFQPYIQGKEYTVDLYRDKNKEVKGVIGRERNRVINGESQVTTTVRKPLLENLCKEAAHALNLYAHATFQALEDASGTFYLIECNPRFGGASTASIQAGLDSFYWFLLEAQRENLKHYPFHRIKGEIRQTRYAKDFIEKIP